MVDLVSHHLVVVGFPLGKAGGWAWHIFGPLIPLSKVPCVLLLCWVTVFLCFKVACEGGGKGHCCPCFAFSFIQEEEALRGVQGEVNLREHVCGSGQFCGNLDCCYRRVHLCLQRRPHSGHIKGGPVF